MTPAVLGRRRSGDDVHATMNREMQTFVDP